MIEDIRNWLKKHDIQQVQGAEQLQRLTHAIVVIPWGEGRTIEEVLVTKKVGTCTGKHLVLQACLEALHIPCRPVVCTFRWQDQGLKLPQHLQQILDATVWDHGHSFLQVQIPSRDWIDVDVTWDPALASYGCPSLPEDWDARTSFVGVKKIIDRWNNVSITDKKKVLVDQLSSEQREHAKNSCKDFLLGSLLYAEISLKGCITEKEMQHAARPFDAMLHALFFPR